MYNSVFIFFLKKIERTIEFIILTIGLKLICYLYIKKEILVFLLNYNKLFPQFDILFITKEKRISKRIK